MLANASSQRFSPLLELLLGLLIAFTVTGCSVRKVAVNTVAGALAGGGSGTNVFTSDDDPELIEAALPFTLKTFEALLLEVPENTDLLLATCQGYALYAYSAAEMEADRLEVSLERGAWRKAKAQRERSLALYLRARGYCFDALEQTLPGLVEELRDPPAAGLQKAQKEHVPLLYWTAGVWGKTISQGLDQPEMVVDLPAVRALLERSLELDPTYEDGSIHEAKIILEGLGPTMGGSFEKAREHYEEALRLSGGKRASLFVTYAQSVSIGQQDRDEFLAMLDRAEAVSLDDVSENSRLTHVLSLRSAALLRSQLDDLFLPPLEDDALLEDSEEELLEDTSGRPGAS